MKREIVYSSRAPEPIGPYSQAYKAGNTIYVSGQIAIDPETGILTDRDIKGEARFVLEHIKSILNEAGADEKNIVKCSIFLKNIDDFVDVNEVYAAFFGDHAPARETVEVSKLPKDARVEISCIAVVD